MANLEQNPVDEPLADDEIRLSVPSVVLCIGDDEIGSGLLQISIQAVTWVGDGQTETFSFPDILLHAVCRDTSAYPKPCLYCHVDRGGESVEIRFVPDERASGVDSDAAGGSNIEEENAENVVDRIFRVMSECASLHPDPIDDHSAAGGVAGLDDADLNGGDYFFTAADFAQGVSEEGARNLNRLSAMLQVSPDLENSDEQQFDDPEEDGPAGQR